MLLRLANASEVFLLAVKSNEFLGLKLVQQLYILAPMILRTLWEHVSSLVMLNVD